jgi:precorrin-3B synthase
MRSTLAQHLSTPTPDPSPQGGGENRRRGACPGLSVPMPTGDGLLVRLRPVGTMTLAAFARLCAAARTYGNGIVEVTARGSIQVRGLSAASATAFAEKIAALDIAAEEGAAVHVNPLAGLDPDEIFDAGKIAAHVRAALSRRLEPGRLSPKISVVIDGGGVLNLDALSADVRLRAEQRSGAGVLRACVGGDHAHASQLGLVSIAHGVEAALRLLEAVAHHGPEARSRNIIAAQGAAALGAAIADLLLPFDKSSCPRSSRASTSYRDTKDVDGRDQPDHDAHLIGLHRLRHGLFACGIGLPFGHADAATLERLADAARDAGAIGFRAAPSRVLIALGMSSDGVSGFAAEAERLGFIVRPDDPRRHVVACAGAPFCASGQIAARTMAPRVAECVGNAGKEFTIHVSGCAKGCAHPAPARLTIVGTSEGCALIADGTTRDAPFAVVALDRLPEAIARAVREERHV